MSSTQLRLKNFLSILKNTPFHPQWHSFRDEYKLHKSCREHIKGIVIDIGCANKRLKTYLSKGCCYYGLDYLDTVAKLYKTNPDVFADAQRLPIIDHSVDTVALIEVLEHVPDPNIAIAEASRILKINGILIITVPFLYPLHDAPYDFHRWSQFALEKLASQHQFSVIEIVYRGQPSETAALLSNIAAVKTALNMTTNYNPIGLLLLLLLPIFVPLVNILGAFFALFNYKDGLMPFGYRAVFKKNKQ